MQMRIYLTRASCRSTTILSPKKVPALTHNGRAIAESSVILEYIDRYWNNTPKLLPQDLNSRKPKFVSGQTSFIRRWYYLFHRYVHVASVFFPISSCTTQLKSLTKAKFFFKPVQSNQNPNYGFQGQRGENHKRFAPDSQGI